MRALALTLVAACGFEGNGTGPRPDGHVAGADGGSDASTLRDRQRQLAIDLRGVPHFMIGIGNDNSGPFDHDVPIDLHYVYLVGYGDRGGWPTWNANGDYPALFLATDTSHGVTSMFTYYQLAQELENHNDTVLLDTARMHQYLADVRLLFEKLAGARAAVQLEPDFFGFLMQRPAMAQLPASVAEPECTGLPQTAAGLMRCVLAIARATAPSVRIGFQASGWGSPYDVTDPNANIEASALSVAGFLLAMGAGSTDFVTVETLDRDAGFWETSGGGGACSVTTGSRGPVYWDEANVQLPNFAQHVRWVNALAHAMQLPALEWQTPLGAPATTCGGSDNHWRDNRVHYFFAHVPELIDAGIAGMTFGTGADRQTDLASDGDQFKAAAVRYRAAPIAL